MNAFLAFISALIAEILAKFVKDRGKAVDGDADPSVLRRAGSRISDWVHKNRSGSRIEPDSSRTERDDSRVLDAEGRVDPVGQQGDGS